MLLKNCSYIITQNPKREILRNADVLIEENRIAQIGKNLKDEEMIDCSGKILMPGLINTHTHLGMHSLKGKSDEAELFDWLKSISNEEAKLTPKKTYENTLDGLREAIRFGTTTIYDSYKFSDARLEAFEEAKVRGVISSTVNNAETLKDSKKFLSGLKSKLVKGAIAANSICNCDEETLKKVIEFSNSKKLLRRIHVGETRKERYDILQQKGKLAIEYLDSIGFLGKNCLLVHCIWITKGEIRKIAGKKAKVSHNPVSNMKLASGGVMPLVEMLEENITVGLGTDSVASNNNLDMFEEMKTAALLHKHHKWNPKAITSQQILDMATIKGTECLMLDDIGSIEKGKKADLITLDIEHNLKPINDVISSAVYSANGLNVSDVIIDGKIRMEKKSLLF
ncbi:MAG: amidohydrolase [archaeon]|nr:amidohydrolase [archaeon]